MTHNERNASIAQRDRARRRVRSATIVTGIGAVVTGGMLTASLSHSGTAATSATSATTPSTATTTTTSSEDDDTSTAPAATAPAAGTSGSSATTSGGS